jgi:twitching motility two-component system response regulator PilG
MIQRQYQTQQLTTLLETIQNKQASGALQINASISSRPTRSRILVWQNGTIAYAGSKLPHIPTLAQKLIKQFKPSVSDTAIKFAGDKVTNPASAREFFEILCKVRILTWEQIESYFQTQAAITIEQLLPYGGQFQFSPAVEFDLSYGEDCHGLNWSKLKFELARRKDEWANLAPTISSMEDAPSLPNEGLDAIPTENVRLHAQQHIDGKRSIVEIAERIEQDPLQLARLYLTWSQTNWIVFEGSIKADQSQDFPTILSVDDSPIVQTMIKRSLGDRYNVLLASNAVDALNLLNQKSVALLLLDVTMPDIDGLEMCRTVRSIPKFRDLPVVMLTARDSLIDKMKGQIAGTNRYLTKPFDKEKLLEIVGEFVGLSGKTNQ